MADQATGLDAHGRSSQASSPLAPLLDLVRRAFEAEWEMLPYRRYPLIALQRKYNGQPLPAGTYRFTSTRNTISNAGDVPAWMEAGKETRHAFISDALQLYA